MSWFAVHAVEGAEDVRVGPEVLTLVREEQFDGSQVFHVLVHHDEDGYTFSESFLEVETARRRFEKKRTELVKALGSTGSS